MIAQIVPRAVPGLPAVWEVLVAPLPPPSVAPRRHGPKGAKKRGTSPAPRPGRSWLHLCDSRAELEPLSSAHRPQPTHHELQRGANLSPAAGHLPPRARSSPRYTIFLSGVIGYAR